MIRFLSLEYAAVAQPIHSRIIIIRIGCCVEGSETTDAQSVVGVTSLMETGCTSASAWAETVQNAPLPSGEVDTRQGNSWVIDDLGLAGRSVSQAALQRSSVEDARSTILAGGMANETLDVVEDVLVNRNMRFPLEIMDEVCRELDDRWSDWDRTGSHWGGDGRMVP